MVPHWQKSMEVCPQVVRESCFGDCSSEELRDWKLLSRRRCWLLCTKWREKLALPQGLQRQQGRRQKAGSRETVCTMWARQISKVPLSWNVSLPSALLSGSLPIICLGMPTDYFAQDGVTYDTKMDDKCGTQTLWGNGNKTFYTSQSAGSLSQQNSLTTASCYSNGQSPPLRLHTLWNSAYCSPFCLGQFLFP